MEETVTAKAGPPCPTPTAHRRLEEAHRFWHQCLDEYQDPSGFRTNLNACIQALRNVTWVLQKEKDLIPNFNSWYPEWQAQLKSDPIMRWLLKSRNRIVKEGDLETESRTIARVIISYADAAAEVEEGLGLPRQRDDDLQSAITSAASNHGDAATAETEEVSAPARYSLPQILGMISKLPIPVRVLRQSSLTVERRWVDKALPDREVLDSLAYAFGVLEQLIGDAHDRAGRKHGVAVRHSEGIVLDSRQPRQGRLPCMVTSRKVRTLVISLNDLRPETGGKSWHVEYDEGVAAEALKKYGDVSKPPISPESPVDLLPYFIEVGKQILRRDKEHGWFIHYFLDGRQVHAEVLMARHNADKRDLAQRVAELVAINGFDGVIVTGEAWVAPRLNDAEGAPIPAGQHPDREEILLIHAEDAAGRRRAVYIPFERRRGRKTTVGEPLDDSGSFEFLNPVRAVWRGGLIRCRRGPQDHLLGIEHSPTYLR